MNVVIIKYNGGNVGSVQFALSRLGIKSVISDNPDQIAMGDKVIFPGVGEAGSTMRYLQKTRLNLLIPALKQPVLAICLGMQLLCQSSEEGDVQGLGVFDVNVRKFPSGFKVPHMGWNQLNELKSPLFEGIQKGEYVYFVHSYYAEMGLDTISTTEYALPFSSSLHKKNFFGTQFHPEKSGMVGERILKNFIAL